jgi:Zn-dependent protease with chaperone function
MDRGVGEARRAFPSRPGLLPLPSLFLRSTMTLFGLDALLGAVLIAAVEFAGVDLDWAVGIGLGIMLLQFLLGPLFMDWFLPWMYQLSWVSTSELPPHLTRFVEKICGDHKIKFPRFGIIADGAPQGFTYGTTPNNARVVISRGVLELLTRTSPMARGQGSPCGSCFHTP